MYPSETGHRVLNSGKYILCATIQFLYPAKCRLCLPHTDHSHLDIFVAPGHSLTRNDTPLFFRTMTAPKLGISHPASRLQEQLILDLVPMKIPKSVRQILGGPYYTPAMTQLAPKLYPHAHIHKCYKLLKKRYRRIRPDAVSAAGITVH